MSTYPPLPCTRIVFRAILYPEWREKGTGLPKWQNFKRRRVDTDGVSLGLTEARCIRDLNSYDGVVTVHIGRVRDVSSNEGPIDVIQDEPEHSIIVGLSYPFDEDGIEIQDYELKAKVQALATQILEHVLDHIRKHS